jgi:hypothetical protein
MSFHRWVQLIEVILVAGIFGMSYWSLHMSRKKQRRPSHEKRDEKS